MLSPFCNKLSQKAKKNNIMNDSKKSAGAEKMLSKRRQKSKFVSITRKVKHWEPNKNKARNEKKRMQHRQTRENCKSTARKSKKKTDGGVSQVNCKSSYMSLVLPAISMGPRTSSRAHRDQP